MNFDIFQRLRSLENDQLTFLELELDNDYTNLIVSAVSSLSFEEIDSKIKLALNDFNLILSNKSEHAQHNLILDGPELIDVEFNGAVDFAIEYRMEAKTPGELFVPAEHASEEILTENAVLSDVDHSFAYTKHNCPDCKDGFYYPLIGPPEPCRTCK